MPKTKIEAIIVDSPDSVFMDIDKHVEQFKRDGVVVFRGTTFSRDEQLKVTQLFGDRTKWFPNSSSGSNKWSYEESHADTINKWNKKDLSEEEFLIWWHLEHMGYPNPATGASWNMEIFKCAPTAGNTLFVNVCDIYDMLPEEDREFLKKCKIGNFSNWSGAEIPPSHDTKFDLSAPTINDAVVIHPMNGRNVLRLTATYKYGENAYTLARFDDREPSEAETLKFMELSEWYTDQIHRNDDLLKFHMWEEGDLLMVDLLIMAHSVKAGFTESERFFHGLWCHAANYSKYGDS